MKNTSELNNWKIAVASLSLIAVWAVAVRQLSLEWSVNPLYQYGWWVIPLGLYLFFERIASAPGKEETPRNRVLIGLVGLFILIYIPLRIVQEANFDWILLNWVFGAFALSVTFLWMHSSLGKAEMWHFAFPVLFVLSSIPWPVGFENLVLQNLMRINATITAHVLSWGSLNAVAHGNIIEVGGEMIGVEEACSGIRSLQTSLMMSLFLGEFYRLKVKSRIFLLLLSFFLAFVFNSSRTVVLTYIGATEGLFSLESWHDPLGYGVLVITLFGLWGTAYWYSLNQETKDIGNQTVSSWFRDIRLPNYSIKVFSALIIVLVAGEFINELWYRLREKTLVQAVDFSVDFPRSAENFREETFSEITRKILKYSEGNAASWTGPEGNRYSAYLLEWEPMRVSKKLVLAHTPEICYPAAGYKMESLVGIEPFQFDGVSINFKVYLFRENSNHFYVFHGVWEEKHLPSDNIHETEPLSRQQRIETVLQGKRNLGQKILGISIAGPNSIEEAESILERTLKTIIIPSHVQST
ncbi:MAG: archaeosortase/exosortase family protein [Verrucomicrobiae bacterium]|nr:archaeosortase/exosortase family protein [Verrucomicrobiae bacterium]